MDKKTMEGGGREGGAGKIVILSTLSTNHKAGQKKKKTT